LAKKTTKKKAPKKRKRTRYTPDKKKELLKKYHSLTKSGKTTSDAAKEVGVPYITLRSWEKKKGGKKPAKTAGKKRGRPKGKARTQAKAATVSTKKGQLVLETPKGFRIEGLSPKDLVKVLREVS